MTSPDLRPRVAPGPRGVPLFGSVFDAWRDPLALFRDAWRRYGDAVRFRFGPYEYVLLNHPDAVRHVLVDHAKNYVKSRHYAGLKLVVGEGLLTSEGEFWRAQRKLAQPAFHRERVAGFVAGMADATAEMLAGWPSRGEPRDLHQEMMRLTFRIVGRALLSAEVHGAADAVGAALTVALERADAYAEALVRVPPWVPTPANLRFRRAMRTLDELVSGIVAARRAAGDSGSDLLGMLMAATDDVTRAGMTDRQLRDEVMTLVLAGHETTANALTWLFYLLSTHPDVERAVHREVAEVLGASRAPTAADLPRLRYTQWTVQEAMRLYPPAWAFERQALGADVAGGYALAAGTIVGLVPYLLHRHPAFWENPEGFDPGRFAPERAEGRHKHAYLPFGGGPRQCIGNGFAMAELVVVTALVVQRCRLALVPGQRVELDPGITLRPRHGLWVTTHARAAGEGVA